MNVHHQKKTHELVDTMAAHLKLECEFLASTGGIDTLDYDPDHYVLAKVLITAAMHRLKDQFAPLFDQERKAAIQNLISM